MNIDQTTLVFFDASCLIAAAGSPSGGSGFLLSLCRRGLLGAAVSQPVLLEAERNIGKRRGPEELETYHRPDTHLEQTTRRLGGDAIVAPAPQHNVYPYRQLLCRP